MQVMKFSFVMVLCMGALFAPPAESAITSCSQVTGSLLNCIGYLQGRSPLPLGACCAGVRGLANSATTTADHRLACNCMKTAGGSLGINYRNAASLPARCGVRISFNISPNVDCSRIG